MIQKGTTPRSGPEPWRRNLRSRNLGCVASELASSVSAALDFGDRDYDSLDTRPRLRGWLHLGAFVTSIATGAVLIPLGWAHSPSAGLAVTIYCFTVSAMFGISAAYHRRTWSPRGWKIMKLLDHSTIFLFIAGSYTPFSVLALEGTFRWVILGIVWGGALAGIALKTSWPTAPRWVGVPIYLALGWMAVLFFPAILTNLGVTTLVLISAGGLLYSLGAIAYATSKPNPWPGVFGYHEVFHAATIVAAACHYIAVYFAMYAN